MFFIHQVAAPLSKLADRLSVVVDCLLKTAMFLQHVGSAHLVLGAVITHHVQLLLTHPRLSLRGIEKVLQSMMDTGHRSGGCDNEKIYPSLGMMSKHQYTTLHETGFIGVAAEG